MGFLARFFREIQGGQVERTPRATREHERGTMGPSEKMCAWNPSNRIEMKEVTEMLKTISEAALNDFNETSYQKHLQKQEVNKSKKPTTLDKDGICRSCCNST